jgi:hypothetical protein
MVAIIYAGALLAGGAWAQAGGQANPQAARGDKIEWPRTFTGQPDFLFSREEAENEARADANRTGQPMASPATLVDVMMDDTPLNPLKMAQTSATVINAQGVAVPVSETAPALSLMQRLMNTTTALPDISTSVAPDVAEFSAGLTHALTNSVANWKPHVGKGKDQGLKFDGVLQSLTLQAVVTSPVRYAVINQQRYAQGDSFLVQVPLEVPDDVIMGAMNAQMPASGTVTAATMQSYTEAYANVMKTFYAARKRNPAVGEKILTVPVLVKSIQSRKVLLDIQGEVHELDIKYTY